MTSDQLASADDLGPHAPRWRSALFPMALAVVSGVLYFLAFPGPGLWPLGFVALVPLLFALRDRTPRQSLALGWLTGFTTTIAGFWWLLEMLRKYSGFPTALCVVFLALLSLYQGARMGVSTWLFARARRNGWPAGPLFLLAFVGLEATFPLLFPWYFGAVLHRIPTLIQVADLGGPVLLSTLLVATNLALADIVRARVLRLPIPRSALTQAILVPALCAAYGAVRIRSVDQRAATAPPLLVGLIQGNVPMELTGRDAYREAFDRQAEMSRKLVEQGVQLVVWSESAFLYSLDASRLQSELDTALHDQLRVPNIVGAIVEEPGEGRRNAFNSALMVRQGGVVDGRYDKRYLLPFGEYIPLGETFPKLYEWSPSSGRITPGRSWAPLPFEDKRITVLICYEDVVPSFVNEAVDRAHPHLLVNLTNDAWFGDTWEPWMHHALAQLRAVEHHRYLVRATNTGVSSIIDPVGRVLGYTGPFVTTSMTGEVRWMYGETVYEVLGDAPWYLAAIVSALAAFLRRPSRWKGGRHDPHHRAVEV